MVGEGRTRWEVGKDETNLKNYNKNKVEDRRANVVKNGNSQEAKGQHFPTDSLSPIKTPSKV